MPTDKPHERSSLKLEYLGELEATFENGTNDEISLFQVTDFFLLTLKRYLEYHIFAKVSKSNFFSYIFMISYSAF